MIDAGVDFQDIARACGSSARSPRPCSLPVGVRLRGGGVTSKTCTRMIPRAGDCSFHPTSQTAYRCPLVQSRDVARRITRSTVRRYEPSCRRRSTGSPAVTGRRRRARRPTSRTGAHADHDETGVRDGHMTLHLAESLGRAATTRTIAGHRIWLDSRFGDSAAAGARLSPATGIRLVENSGISDAAGTRSCTATSSTWHLYGAVATTRLRLPHVITMPREVHEGRGSGASDARGGRAQCAWSARSLDGGRTGKHAGLAPERQLVHKGIRFAPCDGRA